MRDELDSEAASLPAILLVVDLVLIAALCYFYPNWTRIAVIAGICCAIVFAFLVTIASVGTFLAKFHIGPLVVGFLCLLWIAIGAGAFVFCRPKGAESILWTIAVVGIAPVGLLGLINFLRGMATLTFPHLVILTTCVIAASYPVFMVVSLVCACGGEGGQTFLQLLGAFGVPLPAALFALVFMVDEGAQAVGAITRSWIVDFVAFELSIALGVVFYRLVYADYLMTSVSRAHA